MITLSINVTRVDRTALFEGKNGKYLSLTLHENKNGKDQFGNHGFVMQDLGKERRMAGEKGPILGNYKDLNKRDNPPPRQDAHNAAKSNGYQPQRDNSAADIDGADDIPFAKVNSWKP